MGLGPAGPPAHRLTHGRLEAIVKDALTNPTYWHRAEILGEKFRREDGVVSAIRLIERQLRIWPAAKIAVGLDQKVMYIGGAGSGSGRNCSRPMRLAVEKGALLGKPPSPPCEGG